MQMTSTVTYHATPTQVIEALLSEELAQARAGLAHAGVEHSRNGNTATTVITVAADRLPAKLRSFAKSGARATVTTTASGNTVTYSVDPHGIPVVVSATMTLAGDETTTATITGDLKVKIPLIGGSIEKKAAGSVERLLAKDARLVDAIAR